MVRWGFDNFFGVGKSGVTGEVNAVSFFLWSTMYKLEFSARWILQLHPSKSEFHPLLTVTTTHISVSVASGYVAFS